MEPNPYKSPTATNSPLQERGVPWGRVCISGVLIAISGAVMFGLLSTITFAPDGYAFRDRSMLIAIAIIISGSLTSIIGGIGWCSRLRQHFGRSVAGILAPKGQQGCSHGWSEIRVANGAEPVDTIVNRNSAAEGRTET
jgi:hypothetical protein